MGFGEQKEKVEIIAYKRLIERDSYLAKLSNGSVMEISTVDIAALLKAEGLDSCTMLEILNLAANYMLNGKDED